MEQKKTYPCSLNAAFLKCCPNLLRSYPKRNWIRRSSQYHAKDHHVRAVISFFPQITGRSNQKQVNVCLFFEGEKADLTDGLFHWIYDDIGEIVKRKEGEYFDGNAEELEYMITQTLLVDRMPQFDLISNGDYAIS